MLPKENRLSKENDFDAIHRQGRFFGDNYLAIKSLNNNLKISRFGILVGLKVSKKAVIRNRVKRRVRESIRLMLENIKPGFDVLVLTKPETKDMDYKEINESLKNIFKKANLFIDQK